LKTILSRNKVEQHGIQKDGRWNNIESKKIVSWNNMEFEKDGKVEQH
jgi:hypothetical protein